MNSSFSRARHDISSHSTGDEITFPFVFISRWVKIELFVNLELLFRNINRSRSYVDVDSVADTRAV